MGLSSKNMRNKHILRLIFIFSFVNTAILPLIISIDFRYNPFLKLFSEWVTAGQYADMDHEWYQRVAPEIVKTFTIMAFMPIISIVIDLSKRGLFYYLDNGSFFGNIYHDEVFTNPTTKSQKLDGKFR